MADELSTRDAKLIQYRNEAYGNEKELETALQAHIEMAKRVQDHPNETMGFAKRVTALDRTAKRTLVDNLGAAAAVTSEWRAAAAAASRWASSSRSTRSRPAPPPA